MFQCRKTKFSNFLSIHRYREFIVYKFDYNYPPPGTLDTLILDFGKRGALVQFFAEKVEYDIEDETFIRVIYFPNTFSMVRTVGVRIFYYSNKKLEYIWEVDDPFLQDIQVVLSEWLSQDSWRLIRDNGITEKIGPRSFIITPIVDVGSIAFLGPYSTGLPVVIFIEYLPNQSPPTTWILLFYTPPNDRVRRPFSLTTPAEVLLNQYARGQTILFQVDRAFSDTLERILTIHQAIYPAWPTNLQPR